MLHASHLSELGDAGSHLVTDGVVDLLGGIGQDVLLHGWGNHGDLRSLESCVARLRRPLLLSSRLVGLRLGRLLGSGLFGPGQRLAKIGRIDSSRQQTFLLAFLAVQLHEVLQKLFRRNHFAVPLCKPAEPTPCHPDA